MHRRNHLHLAFYSVKETDVQTESIECGNFGHIIRDGLHTMGELWKRIDFRGFRSTFA